MRDDAGPLVVPELHCPVPPLVSPYARRLDREVARWARSEDLCPTPVVRRRLTLARFGTLAARTCPDASEERLTLHVQWLALGLFWDETFFRPVREGVPGAAALAARAADAAMATVSALAPGGMPGGLPRDEADRRRFRLDVLGCLLARIGAMARVEQFSRLGTALTLWLARQACPHTTPAMPPSAPPCLVIAEIVSGCPATAADLAGERLSELTALATERAAWCLRVHTAARHRSVAELVPALPPLLRQGADRHPQRALDRAARLHDECARTYHRAESALATTATRAELAYLTLLRGWQRALHDWSHPLPTTGGTLILAPAGRPAAPTRFSSPAGGATV